MSEIATFKFQVGEWLVEPDIGRIGNSGESRSLRPREMDMLLYFCNHPDSVVTADELIEHVWRGVLVTNDSVYFSLSQLRKSLGDDSKSPSYIETIPKRGYRLIASVAPVAVRLSGDADAKNVVGGPLSPMMDRLPVRAVVSAFVLLLIVGAGLVVGGFFRAEKNLNEAVAQSDNPLVGRNLQEELHEPDINSIAVLPFVDLSPGNDQSYFSDGIAEELLFILSRVKDLKVAARTSSFSFKGGDPSILEIGKTLNVAHVLEGSVRTEGNTVRISAQLISTIDGFLVWSEVYERQLSNILQVQDEIGRAIVLALQIEISGLNSGRTTEFLETDPELYVKYLKGLDAYRTFSFDSLPKAEQLFTEVTEADPKFAKAFRMLGMTKTGMHNTAVQRDPETRETARKLLERALELDPEDAQSYVYLGALYCENGEEGEGIDMLRKALDLSPSNSEAKVELASVLARQGLREDARNLFREAVEGDPINETVLLRFAQFNVQMGNSELALAGFRRAHNANKANPNIPYHIGRELVAQYGNLSAGAISYDLATRLDEKDHELAAFLALAYLWAEAPEMAKVPLQRAQKLNTKSALVAAAQSLMFLTTGDSQQSLELALATLKEADFYHSHGSKNMLVRIATSELLEQGRAEEAERLVLDIHPKLLSVLDGTLNWKGDLSDASHGKGYYLYAMMVMADIYKYQERQAKLLSVLEKLKYAGYYGASKFRDRPRLSDYSTSAELFALQGDDNAALDSLSIAIQGGFRLNWQVLMEKNHAYSELRDTPRFVALMDLIKTQAAQHRAILRRDLQQKAKQDKEALAQI